MHRTFIVLSLGAALSTSTFSTSTWATPLDDAGKAIDRIGQTADGVGDDLRRLFDALARQVNGLTEASKRLDRAAEARKQTAPAIARAIESGNAELAAARDDLTARQRALRNAEASLARAKQLVIARRAAMAQVDRAEREAFESSPGCKTADAKITAAEERLAAVEREAMAGLAADPAIVALNAEVAQARKVLEAVRAATPVDDAALAEASGRSIDATNRLVAATTLFHRRNGKHVEAEDALRDARTIRTDLQDAFERSILARPGVAAARIDLVEAAHAQADVERDLTAARDALGRAGVAVANRRASVQLLIQIDRDATDRLDLLANDVRLTRDALLAVARDLGDVAKRVTAGDRDVQAAHDAVDRAKADQPKTKK